MSEALMIQLIAFVIAETPTAIHIVQSIINTIQAARSGVQPSPLDAVIVAAVAARKAAVDQANATK